MGLEAAEVDKIQGLTEKDKDKSHFALPEAVSMCDTSSSRLGTDI